MLIELNRNKLIENVDFKELDSIIKVTFYRNQRKNSQILKYIYISLPVYKIDNITNILESYINNYTKDINTTITIIKGYNTTYNNHDFKSNLSAIPFDFIKRKKHYSIECLINDIVESFIIATNGESIKELVYAHEDNSVRYWINKFYNSQRGMN